MTGSPEFGRDSAEVFDFVSLFCADQDDGKVRPLAEYLTRFPGHERAIAAEYERLIRPAAAAEPPLRTIGHYEILGQLGSGGQGVVLLAEDTRLRRRVALKVLAPHLAFVSTERLQRFRREAELLSQLDHPAICPVYEADTCDGVPFLAMRYVEGRTLAAILRDRRAAGELPRTRVQLHEVMQWIETAARAVHEAHEHGVIHRDIKPGNLMITEPGTPVLLDFGLARSQGTEDVEITRTGDLLGTLGYMAPELLGRRSADHRADVYALGVTLYECLTQALPFASGSQTALWRAIEAGQVTAPRQHNAAIPPELAAVVLTAMAVAPAHRYGTAAELADDLERVRRREPIRARRVPLAVRTLRWLQRHPTLSLGLGASFVLIVSLATSLERVSANERAASALNQAIQPSGTDEGAARALANLVAAAAGSPRADLRNAMLQVLDACHLSWQTPRTRVPAFEVDPPPAIDPTGRLAALGDHDGVIAVRNTTTGELLARRRIHTGSADDVVFLDDHRIASIGVDGLRILAANDLTELAMVPLPCPIAAPPDANASLCLARTAAGERLAIGAPGSLSILNTADWSTICTVNLEVATAMRRIAFAASGHHCLVLGKEGGSDPHGCNRGWIVDTTSARLVRRLDLADQALLWAEWHPQLEVLALAYNGGRVEIRDVPGERRFATQVAQEVNWCGFDPSGDLLLLPTDRGTDLWPWREPNPQPRGHLAHPSERTIGAAQFDRERHLFAAVLRDGLVLVYSTVDWRLLRQFKVPVKDVRFLSWLPHSGSLLTADLDQLSCWLAGVRPHSPELWGHDDAVTTVAMHPDGRRVLTGSRDGTARLWSLDEAAPLHVLPHPGALRRVHFDRSGDRLLTIDQDADARLWDTATGQLLQRLHGHAANVVDAWFLADDRRAISIGDDGQAIVWELATGTRLRTLAASPAPLHCAALHATRPWLAVGAADRHVTVWDYDTGAQIRRTFCSDAIDDWRIDPVHQVRGLAFDPGSDCLFASLVNNVLLRWDIAANWAVTSFGGDRYGGALVDDPRTGEVLCADYSFGRLTIYRDGAIERLAIDGAEAHANRISAIRIDSSGTAALSAGHDGQLLVWDLVHRVPMQVIRLDHAILDADFSRDGNWVITAGADGRVKLWPRDPLRTAREYLARRSAGSVR